MRPARVFISVCEDSADVHAAALVRAARTLLPDAHFYGLTGPRTRAAGVETVFDLTAHAAMLSGVFGMLGRAWRALRAVERSWRQAPPDAVVLLDSPELHLRLARRAHQRGLPVLYYIAPQTWASRPGRNRQIARDVDRLACILPFEEEYFRGVQVPAEFVGHPLFETLRREHADADRVAKLRGGGAGDSSAGRAGTKGAARGDASTPLVALLPGSRRHVIDAMLPLQLEVVRRMRAAGCAVRALVSCVATDRLEQVRGHIAAAGEEANVAVADNASLLTAADLVLVASGTATLHVAHYRKPMIVMYDAGRLLYWPHRLLGRWFLTTPHLSLVNILAQARVVPEFMPFIRDIRPIAEVACQLLTDTQWRQVMTRQLDELVAPLETGTPSARVCGLLAEMLGRSAAARPVAPHLQL